MYQALYRKWRPQTFDEVIGQQHVTETLKNQVRNDRLSHAYLFIGSRGTGKTTCARILAKAVNCEHPVNGNPCGECAACRGISGGTVLDVVELDAASNNGVDNVRALREEALFSPTSVKKRVYIIDEVHMLSTAAFNALLKILEEPPKHLMFILATTELQKVPATILSRCQRHSFRRIDTEGLTAYLESIAQAEHFVLSHEAAELIARLADGGVRDALSLLDQCSASEKIDVDAVYNTMGLAGNRRVAELLDRILERDTEAVLRSFGGMWMDGKNPAGLLGELNGLMRDVLMLRVAPKGARDLLSGAYDTALLNSFAGRMTTEELLSAMETVQRTMNVLRDTANPRMQVELCLVALCEDAAGESISSLRARISRLEEDVARGIPLRRGLGSLLPDRDEESPELPYETETSEVPPLEERLTDTPCEGLETVPDPAVLPAETTGNGFSEVLEAMKPNLPLGLRFSLDDPNKLCGVLERDVLRLEAMPGFTYDSLNKQEILQGFEETARRICGREMRVQLTALRPAQRQVKDLNELRQYPEVHFTDTTKL